MRADQIKFRGKSVTTGNWVYGYLMPSTKPYIHPNAKYSISVCTEILHSIDRYIYEVNPDTIGQYTTVNDVNDKPAYEGDIVMAFSGKKSFPYQIVFHDGCFRLADGDGRLWHNIDDFPFEVIGNIFDNKSLLED